MKKAKPTSIRQFAFRNDYDNPQYFRWRSKAKDKKMLTRIQRRREKEEIVKLAEEYGKED